MSAFSDMLYAFSGGVLAALRGVPYKVRQNAQEIRLRVGLPLALTVDNRTFYVDASGQINLLGGVNSYIVTSRDVVQTISRLCELSVYSYEGQLRGGFISLRNGCRAGVSGCFDSNEPHNIREYTSVNIRLAHYVEGCAEIILREVDYRLKNILLIGAPGSGKTTLLRDVVRGYSSRGFRVGVADERGEIAAVRNEHRGFDLGYNVDVMTDADKGFAVRALLKYFNPQLIAFDEISDDAEKLQECMSSGVRFVTTLHAASLEQAMTRLCRLNIDSSMFDLFVILNSITAGQIDRIYNLGEKNEMDRNITDFMGACDDRVAEVSADAQAS